MRRFRPEVEACEPRACPTMVFIFPGNALAAASPDLPTQLAADRLLRDGDEPIQVSTPALNGPDAFYRIAAYVRTVSQGQPIGLMGFSAGGALAMRLAGQPGLNVTSVMNYYGPPDLNAWIASHHNDFYYRYVASHVHLTGAVKDLLSGPSPSERLLRRRVRAERRERDRLGQHGEFPARLPDRAGVLLSRTARRDPVCRLRRVPGFPRSPGDFQLGLGIGGRRPSCAGGCRPSCAGRRPVGCAAPAGTTVGGSAVREPSPLHHACPLDRAAPSRRPRGTAAAI